MSQRRADKKFKIHTLAPAGACVAFIQSCWHKDIVDQARKSFAREIGARTTVDYFEVPGALEIPLQAKLLAESGAYDAIVAAGFIVDGGIYRHEFVSAAVIDALMQVQLETEVPVISAVLTPKVFKENSSHHKFFLEHFVIKGKEAAEACLATIANIRALKVRRAKGKAA